MLSFWQQRRDSLSSSSSSSSASSTPSSSPPSLASSFRDTPTIQTSFVSVSVFSPSCAFPSWPFSASAYPHGTGSGSSTSTLSVPGSFRCPGAASAYISDEDLLFDDDDDADYLSKSGSNSSHTNHQTAPSTLHRTLSTAITDDPDDCLAPSYHGARRRQPHGPSAPDLAIAAALFPAPAGHALLAHRPRSRPSKARSPSRSAYADSTRTSTSVVGVDAGADAAPLPSSHNPTWPLAAAGPAMRKRRRSSSSDRRGRRISAPMEVIEESPEHE